MRTRFTELLGCAVPIQLAGMPGMSTPELAAAVTEAGGLGTLAATMLSPAALASDCDRVAKRSEGAFGVNFLIPFLDPATLEVAAARAGVVEFFYGEPHAELVRQASAAGARVSWQIGSAEEARRAADVGCDFVIAQGTEAGGHVRGALSLLPLLDAVLSAVPELPVVAAGGIASGRSLAAVLAAGADGARIGTRFLAAKESGAHPEYVSRLLAAHGEDTVLTEAFSVMWPGAPHRVLRSCLERAKALPDGPIGRDGELEVARFSVICPSREAEGTIDAMCLYAGEGVGSVTKVQSAASIVRELVRDAESALARAPTEPAGRSTRR